MSTGQIGILLAIAVYLILMIYIGYYFSKKSDSSAEGFYLGNRKLGPLVAAMSAEASDMSSWLLMGLPVWRICRVSQMRAGRPSDWRPAPISTG